MRGVLCVVIWAALALTAGCGISSTPQNPPPLKVSSPDELIAAWKQLPETTFENMDFNIASAIVETLAKTAPDRLEFLWEVLADSQAKPNAKVLATFCLQRHIQAEDAARLIALAAPDKERTTRGCALNLLSGINTPEAVQAIRGMLDDADTHVAAEAAISLLRRDDPAALERVEKIWNAPDTSIAKKVEIILALPDSEAARFLPLIQETAKNAAMDLEARKRAVTILAGIGAPDDLALLESLANDPEEVIQALAKSGIEAAKARAAAPAGENTPPLDTAPAGKNTPALDGDPLR